MNRVVERAEPAAQSGEARRKLILVLWPSFIAALGAEFVFFGLFDPMSLPFGDASVPFSELPLGEHRVLVYSIGFFAFWLLGAISSALTLFFQHSERGH